MTPNTDRFLTRVFDKQEKKMFYMGCRIGTLKLGEDMRSFEAPEFSGINNFGFLIEHIRSECLMRSFIPFGDRFIPMQCYGERDKNKKLIYDGDMVTGCYDDYELAEAMGMDDFKITNGLVKFENGCFSLYEIDCFDINDHEDFSCHMNMTKDVEIIGNRWEQPELWELKQ